MTELAFMQDSAGGKVQDTKRGPKGLDLFGGGPSGETPSSKAEELIEKAEVLNFFFDLCKRVS